MKLDAKPLAEIPPGQDYENEQACATGQQRSAQRTQQDSSSSAFEIIEIPAIGADSGYGMRRQSLIQQGAQRRLRRCTAKR